MGDGGCEGGGARDGADDSESDEVDEARGGTALGAGKGIGVTAGGVTEGESHEPAKEVSSEGLVIPRFTTTRGTIATSDETAVCKKRNIA